MKSILYTFFLSILLGIIFSCENETIEVTGEPVGRSYFPLSVGSEWIYQVDSIIYDESQATVDTTSGFVRELITEQLNDGSYRIERYFSRQLSSDWEITDVWSARYEDTRAVRNEENLSFIKLVFPPALDVDWDGNSLFDENVFVTVAGELLQPYKFWDYRITEIDGTYNLENNVLSDVVTVSQVNNRDVENPNLVERRVAIEQYADNVGLVFKQMEILDSRGNYPAGTPFEDRIERGFRMEQRLIQFR